MSRTLLYRVAAVALVVGAVLSAAGNLLAPQGDARAAVASGTYYPAAVAVLLGSVLVMAGWPAAYLRQRAQSGILGFVGMVVVFAVGMVLTVGWSTVQLLLFPWVATTGISDKALDAGPLSFTLFFAVSSALVSLGGILFGIATVRARVFSRQLGVGLIVLAVLSAVLGFLSLPGGGGISMSWWWGTTGTFGVVAYMVALGWYGVELFRRVGGGSEDGPPAP
ncbi:MAG TPA: hypothetical protein VHX67_07125 [Acidimicrobiales bacterium]|jgi:hypothetical protein|nr:hypothetical protein [Acidimicrobiales bacterium]